MVEGAHAPLARALQGGTAARPDDPVRAVEMAAYAWEAWLMLWPSYLYSAALVAVVDGAAAGRVVGGWARRASEKTGSTRASHSCQRAPRPSLVGGVSAPVVNRQMPFP